MKKQRVLVLAILVSATIILASFTSRVWMSSGARTEMSGAQTSQAPPFVPSNPPRQDPKILGLVRRNSVSSRLHGPLQALGNRLEVKGRERAVVVGTFRSSGGSQEEPFTLIAELPNRIRLTISSAAGNRVLVFDGQTTRSSGTLTLRDYDVVETLVYDTAEHLLLGQSEGSLAMRFLGGRFHDDDNPEATAYHIFEASEVIALGGEPRDQTRQYYFNSDNWLLERITYPHTIKDVETSVEVRFGDWQRVDGQTLARIVERLEDKASVFRLTINTVSFSPSLNDGIFQ
jgi:hypothetical protein